MKSCQKPTGAPCPWDVVPPWRDITPVMCEACGCLYFKEDAKSADKLKKDTDYDDFRCDL